MFGAPFFRVEFADFWLADQMNSFVNGLLDLQFLICFYITNGNWLEVGGKIENKLLILSLAYRMTRFRYDQLYGA